MGVPTKTLAELLSSNVSVLTMVSVTVPSTVPIGL